MNALFFSKHVNAIKKLELSGCADMEHYRNERQATFQTQMTTITELHQIQIIDLTKEKEGLLASVASTKKSKHELLAILSDLE